MSIYDKASLVLIPSGTKTSKVYSQKPTNGDGDFDFTRSTAATRVNADGNIEKETQNLLLRSNKFDTTWSLSSATIASGQSGYDGSNNAWNFTTSAAGASLEQSVTTAGVVVFSLYAKANGINGVRLRIDAATDANGYFNLSTGAVHSFAGSAINASITSVGGGWYRCEVAANISSPVKVAIYTTDGTTSYDNGSILIQDSQLEQGLVARDYIETTTTALYGGITDNVPRLDYTDSSCPALLLEPQRSNILTNSEYFAAWIQFNTLNTSNALTSPEGVQNANKLIAASGVNNNVIYQVLSAGTYTASIFAKKGEFEGLVMATGNTGAFFNLNTNTYRTDYSNPPTSYKIEDYGNGWHRYSITFTEGGANNLYIGPNDNVSNSLGVTGNNSDGIYIFGAQLEAGSYATSYIPTYGTSVTRNAESTEKTSIGDLLGQTEGTFYTEFTIDNLQTAYANILTSNHNTTSSVYMVYKQNNRVTTGLYINGNTIGINSTSTYTRGDVLKVAFTYKNGDLALYINGQSEGSLATTWSFANTIDTLYLANSVVYFAYQEQVRMRQALIFKTRLSNEELAALTTI